MKVIDVIFALVAGRVVGFLIGDFLKEWGIDSGFYVNLVIWFVFPILALVCLWIAFLVGRKMLFFFQAAKHFLVGAFAMVVDLKLFELLTWFFGIFILTSPLAVKGISFIFSTLVKYWGNKYWAFQKHEKEKLSKEIAQFFIITIIGLVIDILAFYYIALVIGPQFLIPSVLWVKISIIMAALVAASWNFLGYKFIVFKK